VASLPEGLPSLSVLIDLVRSPGVAAVEIDALLSHLDLPLAPQQSPREHADTLLSLIEDDDLGGLTGSDGRTVRAAAIQALLALGYPYALEVPPEALELQSSASSKSPFLRTSSDKWGLGLAIATAVATLILLMIDRNPSRWRDEHFIVAGGFLGTTVLPAVLSILGHKKRLRFLHHIGNGVLGLAGVVVLGFGIIALAKSGKLAALIPVALGLAQLVTGVLLYSPKPKD
jgi:hypothetical protein